MAFATVLKRALKNYSKNFSTVFGFGLLLVFVFLFVQFSNVFISSGSIFVYYDLGESSIFATTLLFLASAVFLFFHSIFVCLMVFAVRNHLSKVKLHYYLTQKIRKFALKYFVFSVVLSLLAYLLVFVSSALSVPLVLAFFVLFVVFSLLIFVPQSIVVDENSIVASVFNNFEFISKNFSSFVLVIVTGIVLLFLLMLVEFVFDNFLFIGNILSLLLMFFFLIPFIEVLKTQLYMKKFALIVDDTAS